MRFKQLFLDNFLSLQAYKLDFKKPLLLLSGHNEVGKTTIANAISFALTGLPRRANIVKQRDFMALIRHGHDRGSVSLDIETTDGTATLSYYRDIASGKCTGPALDAPLVPVLLDMHKFSSMEPRERLAALVRDHPDFDAIKQFAVDEYGVSGALLDTYRSWAETSLDAIRNKIKERGTELKAEWKAITKENWGEAKGREWKAAKAEALAGFGIIQCPHCHNPVAVGEGGTVIAMHEQDEAVSEAALTIHNNIVEHVKMFHAFNKPGVLAHFAKKALDTINALLEESSQQTGWRQPNINADGEIHVDDEPYYLLSESAQWRADAQITVSIARWSGWRFVILDRLDVLDVNSRSGAIEWLNGAASEMDSIIVIATLKAPPNLAQSNLQSEWMG